MSSLARVIESFRLWRTTAGPSSQRMAPMYAALLGLVLLYAAGFAETEELHNAAHDTRHAAGFPCH